MFLFYNPRHVTLIHVAVFWWLFLTPSPTPHVQDGSNALSFFIWSPSLSPPMQPSLSFTRTQRWISPSFRKRHNRLDIDTARQGCHVCFETLLALQTLGHSLTCSDTQTHNTQTDTQRQGRERRVPKTELSVTSDSMSWQTRAFPASLAGWVDHKNKKALFMYHLYDGGI